MTSLRITSPCHEDWSLMTPQGRGRHCAACDKLVVDLVELPSTERVQALARISRDLTGDPTGPGVCVRGWADHRGRLLPAPPARRRLLTNAIAGILATAALGNLAAADGEAPATCPPAAGGVTAMHLTGEATVAPQAMGRIVAPPAHPHPRPQPLTGAPVPVMGDVATPPPEVIVGKTSAPPAPEPAPGSDTAAGSATTVRVAEPPHLMGLVVQPSPPSSR